MRNEGDYVWYLRVCMIRFLFYDKKFKVCLEINENNLLYNELFCGMINKFYELVLIYYIMLCFFCVLFVNFYNRKKCYIKY